MASYVNEDIHKNITALLCHTINSNNSKLEQY